MGEAKFVTNLLWRSENVGARTEHSASDPIPPQNFCTLLHREHARIYANETLNMEKDLK